MLASSYVHHLYTANLDVLVNPLVAVFSVDRDRDVRIAHSRRWVQNRPPLQSSNYVLA